MARISIKIKNIKTQNSLVFLGARTSLFPADVTHLEAEINYTKVFNHEGENQLLSYTMKNVLEFLENHGKFIRISRKHVINLDYVKFTNEHSLILTTGMAFQPSRKKN